MLQEAEKQAITISVEAAQAVQNIIAEKNMTGHALRIYVSGSSCSGVQLGMALDNKINDMDTTFDVEGVKIVVDHQSLDYTYGANIDFVDDPEKGAGFVINAPQSEQNSCGGCGSNANSCGDNSGGSGCC